MTANTLTLLLILLSTIYLYMYTSLRLRMKKLKLCMDTEDDLNIYQTKDSFMLRFYHDMRMESNKEFIKLIGKEFTSCRHKNNFDLNHSESTITNTKARTNPKETNDFKIINLVEVRDGKCFSKSTGKEILTVEEMLQITY